MCGSNAHDVFRDARGERGAGHRSRIRDGPGEYGQDREEGRFRDDQGEERGQPLGAGPDGERAGPAAASGRDPGGDDAGQPEEEQRSRQAGLEQGSLR